MGARGSVIPMGSRRYGLEIAAPFTARLKTRLERAVTQAIRNPSRAMPTLRRAVISATTELRLNAFSDAEIRSLFTRLVEDVARARSLDSTSIVSGQPRWKELTARVLTWTETSDPADLQHPERE
jgi:hypothetical protein